MQYNSVLNKQKLTTNKHEYQGAFSLGYGLCQRSSAWVLKFCGVPVCNRQDVCILKRVIKVIASINITSTN